MNHSLAKKTQAVVVICLFLPLLSYSQAPKEMDSEYITRLWKTADTVALKRSYEESKVEPVLRSEPTPFEQALILQRIQNEHEWDIEVLRAVSTRFYLQPYYYRGR